MDNTRALLEAIVESCKLIRVKLNQNTANHIYPNYTNRQAQANSRPKSDTAECRI